MTHILEVDSVMLTFGDKPILQDVYLKSETGKVTGLLGRNGAGKSCLMKIIFGTLSPSEKSIRINGNALATSSLTPKDLRYLPQKRFVPSSLTIKRIMCDFELNFADFILYFPEFEKYYMSKLGHLSGGEQRIIEIYIILASETKFCMLDEPFSHIMPIHIEAIKKLILREKANKGIIITDHLYKEIVEICEDIYVIRNGKTYLTKSIADLATLGYV